MAEKESEAIKGALERVEELPSNDDSTVWDDHVDFADYADFDNWGNIIGPV